MSSQTSPNFSRVTLIGARTKRKRREGLAASLLSFADSEAGVDCARGRPLDVSIAFAILPLAVLHFEIPYQGSVRRPDWRPMRASSRMGPGSEQTEFLWRQARLRRCRSRLARCRRQLSRRSPTFRAHTRALRLSERRPRQHDSSRRMRAPASRVPPPSHRVTTCARWNSAARLRATQRRVDASMSRSAVTTPPHHMSAPAFPVATPRCRMSPPVSRRRRHVASGRSRVSPPLGRLRRGRRRVPIADVTRGGDEVVSSGAASSLSDRDADFHAARRAFEPVCTRQTLPRGIVAASSSH